jgi:hypothetical protein
VVADGYRGIVMEARSEPLVWRRVHDDNLSGDAATELRRAITVLEGIPLKLPLDAGELELVQRRLATLNAQVELELGKRPLRAGDIAGAKAHLSRTAAIGNWKLRAVTLAARVAPDLLRRVYLRSRPLGAELRSQ